MGSTKCLGFVFRGSGRNFTIGLSLEICGNSLEICIKIIKNMKDYAENFRKNKIFTETFRFFLHARWEK